MKNIILRTYNKMWKFERKLYAIDDIKLPVPINQDEIIYLAIGFLITLLILKVLPFLNAVPFIVRYIALPYGLMKFLTKKKFDGKLPHKFVLGYIDYMGLPKRIARFKPAQRYKLGYFTSVVYRKKNIINLTEEITKKQKKKRGRKRVCTSSL